MKIRSPKQLDETHSTKPAGAEFWHLWTVWVPRRSITGKLLTGRVWRRHDGHHWIYKRFIKRETQEN